MPCVAGFSLRWSVYASGRGLHPAYFSKKIQSHAHCTCPVKVLSVSGTHTSDLLATEPSVSFWLHHLSLPTTFCLGESGSHLNPSLVVKSSAVCLPPAPLGNLGNTVFYIRGRCNGSNRERWGAAVTTSPLFPLNPHPMVTLSTSSGLSSRHKKKSRHLTEEVDTCIK